MGQLDVAWFRHGSVVCAHNGLGRGSVTCVMCHRWFSCVCDMVQRWFRCVRYSGSVGCVQGWFDNVFSGGADVCVAWFTYGSDVCAPVLWFS